MNPNIFWTVYIKSIFKWSESVVVNIVLHPANLLVVVSYKLSGSSFLTVTI